MKRLSLCALLAGLSLGLAGCGSHSLLAGHWTGSMVGDAGTYSVRINFDGREGVVGGKPAALGTATLGISPATVAGWVLDGVPSLCLFVDLATGSCGATLEGGTLSRRVLAGTIVYSGGPRYALTLHGN